MDSVFDSSSKLELWRPLLLRSAPSGAPSCSRECFPLLAESAMAILSRWVDNEPVPQTKHTGISSLDRPTKPNEVCSQFRLALATSFVPSSHTRSFTDLLIQSCFRLRIHSCTRFATFISSTTRDTVDRGGRKEGREGIWYGRAMRVIYSNNLLALV